MLNRPSPSVTTVRTRSMRAGLAASTVTPGITAFDVSRTTPEMPAACCAHAPEEQSSALASTATATLVRTMAFPLGRLGPASTDSVQPLFLLAYVFQVVLFCSRAEPAQ